MTLTEMQIYWENRRQQMLCLEYEIWRADIFHLMQCILHSRWQNNLKKNCFHAWTMFKSFLDKDFKPVTSCASTAVNKKWVRGIPLKPRREGFGEWKVKTQLTWNRETFIAKSIPAPLVSPPVIHGANCRVWLHCSIPLFSFKTGE